MSDSSTRQLEQQICARYQAFCRQQKRTGQAIDRQLFWMTLDETDRQALTFDQLRSQFAAIEKNLESGAPSEKTYSSGLDVTIAPDETAQNTDTAEGGAVQETVEFGPQADTGQTLGGQSESTIAPEGDLEETIDPAQVGTLDGNNNALGRNQHKESDGGFDETIDPQDELEATIDPQEGHSGFDVTVDPEQTADPAMADQSSSISFSWDDGDALAQDADRATGLEVAGYEIVRELGRGGMGVVYHAQHRSLKRDVALKMILAGNHASDTQLARFRSEAEAVAHLQHKNIVQIYDVGIHDGMPYFSLEFVDGAPMDDALDGKPQLAKDSAAMMETLARAMHFAHEHGIVHRDLKPANVLLTQDGEPKITDFGLVKRIDDEGDSGQTREGTIMGTPSYMAPEQGRGELDIGPAADVYSLGAMLYCMLTGRPPFLAPKPMDTLMQMLKDEPVPPSKLQPRIPRDIETICLKCLNKETHRRYASADELADDLRRFLDDKPIKARRTSLPERAMRWCRRNPKVAALTGAVAALVLVAVFALMGMSARAAREQRAIARTREQAIEQHDLALKEIQSGNNQRAKALLTRTDPLLQTSPQLEKERSQLQLLRNQLQLLDRFGRLADDARYFGLFGKRGTLSKAKDACLALFKLYAELESKTGDAQVGLPPLAPDQQQRFLEDVFETHIVATQVESALAGDDIAKQKKSAEVALGWLKQAELIIPNSRILFYRRSRLHKLLGNAKEEANNRQRGDKINVTSVVDRFFEAISQHQAANSSTDPKKAQQHLALAVDAHAGLLRIRPDHFWAYFDWAGCQAQLGHAAGLRNAVVGFSACIQLRSDVAWPYYNRGLAYQRLKRYDLAVQDYADAIQRNGDYAEAFFNRGICRYQVKKFDLALTDFNQAITLNENSALFFYQRAELYRRQRKFVNAGRDYDRAIKLDPRNVSTLTARANNFFSRKLFDRAAADYSTVLKLNPKDANTVLRRATANMYGKNLDQALADWQRLTKIVPRNPIFQYRVAMMQRVRGDFQAAHLALKKALSINPRFVEALLLAAQTHKHQGNLKECMATLEKAGAFILKGKSLASKAGFYNDRADVFRAQGKFKLAAKDYEQSIKLIAKQTDAYIGLALVRRQQNKNSAGVTALNRMVAANPQAAKVYWRRAEYLRQIGDLDKAKLDCQQALKLDATSIPAQLVSASILAKEGKIKEATSAAKHWLSKARKDNAESRRLAAIVWGLAANADGQSNPGFVRQATTLIVEAYRKGLLEFSYQQFNRLLEDSAFDLVRKQPEVAKLFQKAN